MKKIYLLSLLVVLFAQSVVGGEEKKIKLDSDYALVMSVSTNLEVREVPVQKGWIAAIVIKDRQAKSEMRFLIAKATRQETSEELKQKMVADARQAVLPDAVEKEIVTKEMKGKTFSFFYFQLTDARKDPGEGKYLTQGGGVKANYAVQFMMLSKEQTSAEKEILDCLSTMTLEKAE